MSAHLGETCSLGGVLHVASKVGGLTLLEGSGCALGRGAGHELEGQPLDINVVFLSQSFGPFQTDVAPGSDVVRKDLYFNGFHINAPACYRDSDVPGPSGSEFKSERARVSTMPQDQSLGSTSSARMWSMLCRVVYRVEHEHVQVLLYHASKLFNHLLNGPIHCHPIRKLGVVVILSEPTGASSGPPTPCLVQCR